MSRTRLSRRVAAGGVGVAAVLALVGCGGAAQPTAISGPKSGGPSAAQYKEEARAEAVRLVALASLPPGAIQVRTEPAGLSGPALGTPAMAQLIDRVGYYRIPMSLSQAYAWFKGHPQRGFTQSGTSVSGGPSGPSMYGFEYDLSPSPHWPWGQANLEFGLVAQGPAATAVRVDGVAEWIDPAPMRDISRGPVTRVTIAGGCPSTVRGRTDISNPNASDLDYQLLPAVAPTGALRCTYNGMNGNAFALLSRQRLNASQAFAAAAQIRKLSLGNRGPGVISCPADDGRASILVFSYSGRADVDIWERTSGCTSTDNGHIASSEF